MLFRHLKEIIKKYKFQYIFGILFIIICDALQLYTPGILGRLTYDIENHLLTKDKIYYYMFMVMILAIGVALFRYLWRKLVVTTSRRLEYDLRKNFFSHLEKLSTNYFHHNTTGSLMAHATNDINSVRMSFGMGVVMIIDSSFLTICIIQGRFKNVQEAFEHLTTKVQEAFSGIRVIKAFTQEENENESFAKANENNLQANMKLVRMFGIMFPLIMFISTLSLIVAISLGGIMVINNEMEIGKYVEFMLYLGLLTWPILAIGWVVNVLQRGIASLKRINVIMDEVPEIVDHPDAVYVENLKPSIEINQLNFTYPNTDVDVLNDINVTVEAGKTLAIVGRTGSGKTTLANLMLRLYDTSDDSIKIGGHSINKLTLEQLRETIGYVPQDNFLFSTKIKENISFSNPTMSQEEIEAAAKVAHVHEEIMSFPEGYDTMLGEKGINLSGGQKQRISIARALAKNPDIIIFDDSLSAVDTKTEDSILKYLKNEISDKTVIIIAHRISTIKDADEIIVIDETNIIERGSHDELVTLDGLYNDIYKKQLLEDKVNRD